MTRNYLDVHQLIHDLFLRFLTSDALKIEPSSVVFYYCGWFNFNASDLSIKMVWDLQFLCYMNLKFQKSRTKIEVSLSLAFWNFKFKVLTYISQPSQEIPPLLSSNFSSKKNRKIGKFASMDAVSQTEARIARLMP